MGDCVIDARLQETLHFVQYFLFSVFIVIIIYYSLLAHLFIVFLLGFVVTFPLWAPLLCHQQTLLFH